MKNFIIRIILFLFPIIIIIGSVSAILLLSGENFRNLNSILDNKDERLLGYAYNEDNYRYIKWYELSNKPKFEVVAIGSSRVLQFRKNMFQSTFYNAGYTISTIRDFKPFIESIPKKKYPNKIIIGLDQWMFNTNWDDSDLIKPKSYWEESYSYLPSSTKIKKVIEDIIGGKISVASIYNLASTNKIGLNAMVNNKGMRNDGSMLYGNQIDLLLANSKLANDYRFLETMDRIDKGNRRFQYANEPDLKAFREVEQLLAFCSKNDIQVIAFLPPFPDKIYRYMVANGRYSYINKNRLFEKLKPLFQNHNFEIYDYTHGLDVNFMDEEFIDGFHGGESIYAKILMDISQKSLLLNDEVDNDLKIKLANRKNRYQLQ